MKSTIDEYSQIAMRVSVVCIICNVTLCLVKMAGGFAAASQALVSDGINSLFDVVSGIIVIIGAKLAGRTADREHPYGHERFESAAAIILSIVLVVTGVFVGHTAIEDLISGAYKTKPVPGLISIAAALVSIAVKECMYRYTKANADRINSVSLRAEALDHRADIISTAGALAGIMVSRYGFPAGDLIASLLVCVFILRTAVIVFREGISQMVDAACDDDIFHEIEECIKKVEGVRAIDKLQVRTFGNRLYVDLEIAEDGNITLFEAHDVAERVHDLIEEEFPVVKHIMVHVNPVQT